MMKNRAVRALANNRGFSLIELMIALTIFAVGILALAQLQSSAIVYNSEARRYTEATIVAQSTLDAIRSMSYNDIVETEINDDIDNIVKEIPSYLTVDVGVDPGPVVDDSVGVTVTVSWTYKGIKDYVLTTIIGK